MERFSARVRAPVFVLVGQGGRDALRQLQLDERVQLVDSPRHATILLVAGRLPISMRCAAERVHDQVPGPRAVAVMAAHSDDLFPGVFEVDPESGPGAQLQRLHADLLYGRRQPSAPRGPARNPVHWQGVGPHGQGGKGMMMGTPYGRKMAMTGPDDRDGLMLDRLMVTIGPFLPWLPPGMRLHVALQGDVIQSVMPMVPPHWKGPEVEEIFLRATCEAVSLADLEIARARHQLSVVADLLRLLGLGDAARTALRLARDASPGDEPTVKALERRVFWSGIQLATRGVGTLQADAVAGFGPIARACGCPEDARVDDPAYTALGFQPVCQNHGDTEARLRQRLAEAAQSLSLARGAGNAVRQPGPPVEGPRGRLDQDARERWVKLLSEVGKGQAWDEFVTTVVSLDLDAANFPASEDYAKADEAVDEGGDDQQHGHHDHGGSGKHSCHGGEGHAHA